MEIPDSASDEPIVGDSAPDFGDAYLMNPYFGVELLTFDQAVDLLNLISGEILVDRRNRSKQKH